jgi:Cytochrome c, mono- and diheme variants
MPIRKSKDKRMALHVGTEPPCVAKWVRTTAQPALTCGGSVSGLLWPTALIEVEEFVARCDRMLHWIGAERTGWIRRLLGSSKQVTEAIHIMHFVRYRLRMIALSSALLASVCVGRGQSPAAKATPQTFAPALVEQGQSLFLQHCAFCHGRDAAGGETGPDLTRSTVVAGDVNGDKIGSVVRNGRPEKGMPAFNLPDPQIAALVAFIHTEKTKAESQQGGRRGVDVADLQTGNVEAGKRYFNGAGTCSQCHSPTGDLAGVASRHQGLQLEMQMLYPRKARGKVTVTLPSGETVTGTLAYKDEFTVGLEDASGWYRSWPVSEIKYTVNAPAEAHAELLAKYTDDDIHNLMAYLQTLR